MSKRTGLRAIVFLLLIFTAVGAARAVTPIDLKGTRVVDLTLRSTRRRSIGRGSWGWCRGSKGEDDAETDLPASLLAGGGASRYLKPARQDEASQFSTLKVGSMRWRSE